MKFHCIRLYLLINIILLSYCFTINNKKQFEDLANLNVTYNEFKNDEVSYFHENLKTNFPYNFDFNKNNNNNDNNYDEVIENQSQLNTDKKNKMKSFQNNFDISKKVNSQIVVEKKAKKKDDDYTEIKNNFKINSIKTAINLFSNQASGFIKEKIYFELNKGLHDKVIRKISLGGTSDAIDNLRVSS